MIVKHTAILHGITTVTLMYFAWVNILDTTHAVKLILMAYHVITVSTGGKITPEGIAMYNVS